MYHVSNDLRAHKSAELICRGLEACLAEKPLNKIRVTDIYNKCFVSRSTFYRLFDCINDVFAYECDRIREDTLKSVSTMKFADKNEEVLYCIRRWLTHKTLIKTIVDNRLIGVFYDSHIRNKEQLKKYYGVYCRDEKEFDYFVAALVSLIFAALSIYFQHGETEPIEEVYRTVCNSTEKVIETWKQGLK